MRWLVNSTHFAVLAIQVMPDFDEPKWVKLAGPRFKPEGSPWYKLLTPSEMFVCFSAIVHPISQFDMSTSLPVEP
jgi:hypothetical protein